MARYKPAVGGYQWNQLLAENRRRIGEVREALRQLDRVASTDATRVIILQAQVKCTETLVDIEQLLAMREERTA